MKRFSEQFKKGAEGIRLSGVERRDLRERLSAYMEYHPLPEELRSSMPAAKTKRSYVLNFNAWMIGRTAGALAVLFLIILPVAAERAVPGDTLYPIKVRFNEEVRGTLTFSTYQKVEWETERLERRIAEARLLADAGKLTPEVEAEVTAAVKQHSDAAKEKIESIRESDSDEAAIAEINFTSALDVQSEVLEGHLEKNVQASTSPENKSIAALAGAVNEARAGVVPREVRPESYEKLLARIETETTRAEEYASSIDEVALPEEKRSIERRLSDIKIKVTTAVEETEDRGEAIAMLSAALSDTRKLISFMTNIDVRENVSIDELVPVTLTDEERMALLDQQMSDTRALASLAEGYLTDLATTSEEYIAASAELDIISEQLVSVEAALAEDNLEAAEAASDEAFTLARELEAALRPEEVPEETGESESTDDAESDNDEVDSSAEGAGE